MHTYYAAETLARQQAAEVARKAARAWKNETPSRETRRLHLPRVAWHRQVARPA
jgi:hypothetical protein